MFIYWLIGNCFVKARPCTILDNYRHIGPASKKGTEPRVVAPEYLHVCQGKLLHSLLLTEVARMRVYFLQVSISWTPSYEHASRQKKPKHSATDDCSQRRGCYSLQCLFGLCLNWIAATAFNCSAPLTFYYFKLQLLRSPPLTLRFILLSVARSSPLFLNPTEGLRHASRRRSS